MRAPLFILVGLALLLLSCGGDPSPATPPEARSKPGRVVYYRQSPPPRALVAVSADGSSEEQLFTAGANSGADVIAADCSPDGTAIVYAVAGYDQSGAYGYTLRAADLDGLNNRRLSQDVEAHELAWAPDGESIAFVPRAASDAAGGVWLMDADGTNLRRLTSGPDTQPRWSPDGKQIAFTSMRDGNREIYTVSVEGGEVLNLTRSTTHEVVGWSPDGSQIIYTLGRDIHLINIDGGDRRTIEITPAAELLGYDAWGPLNPRLSFDGMMLAFTAPVPLGPSGDQVSLSATRASNLTVGVYVTNTDGTATHRVDSAESAVFLAWCR